MVGRLIIARTVLNLLKSYLEGRTQEVSINEAPSSAILLLFDVPQGSAPGPLLYLIYTLLIGVIIKCHRLMCLPYFEDTTVGS